MSKNRNKSPLTPPGPPPPPEEAGTGDACLGCPAVCIPCARSPDVGIAIHWAHDARRWLRRARETAGVLSLHTAPCPLTQPLRFPQHPPRWLGCVRSVHAFVPACPAKALSVHIWLQVASGLGRNAKMHAAPPGNPVVAVCYVYTWLLSPVDGAAQVHSIQVRVQVHAGDHGLPRSPGFVAVPAFLSSRSKSPCGPSRELLGEDASGVKMCLRSQQGHSHVCVGQTPWELQVVRRLGAGPCSLPAGCFHDQALGERMCQLLADPTLGCSLSQPLEGPSVRLSPWALETRPAAGGLVPRASMG
nr:uncharacterized protein LOC127486221 [Oryctolagus cuniculus]